MLDGKKTNLTGLHQRPDGKIAQGAHAENSVGLARQKRPIGIVVAGADKMEIRLMQAEMLRPRFCGSCATNSVRSRPWDTARWLRMASMNYFRTPEAAGALRDITPMTLRSRLRN
jgi:hypothetical protein